MVTVSWIKLELDVHTFNAMIFAPFVERCRGAGLQFSTLAALGDSAEHRRALYDLNRQCSAAIPGRGGFHTFKEYLQKRVEIPSFDPAGVVLAVEGADWVRMAATSDWRQQGYVFNEMTGVRVGYRGAGVALAMKVLGVDFARACGVTKIRTIHHPGNLPAIAMNRRLGYVDAKW